MPERLLPRKDMENFCTVTAQNDELFVGKGAPSERAAGKRRR